MESNLSKL
jgi:hypothetical protein